VIAARRGGFVTAPGYQLAQLNIARMMAPLADPVMADFVANLEPINRLAERSPGFVWRLQTEAGDATGLRPYGDDRIIVNLTVWENAAALREFVYRGDHAAIMKRRREWFERLDDLYVVLWWVPAGHRPSVQEALARLEHLKQQGPSVEAFTFREPCPMPGASPSNPARTRDGFNVTRQGCDVIGRAAGRNTAIGAIFNREI
jgi:Domain of unknown function (DUF3291)